jgi:hypothetical protein
MVVPPRGEGVGCGAVAAPCPQAGVRGGAQGFAAGQLLGGQLLDGEWLAAVCGADYADGVRRGVGER